MIRVISGGDVCAACSQLNIHSLRRHVIIVVPQSDHGLGQIAFITQCAETRRAEQKIPSLRSGSEGEPAGGQDTNEVSAGEQQYVSRDAADTLDHAVRALADLHRRFAPGGAIPKQIPVRPISQDLRRSQSFLFAVVPFHQVRIKFRAGSKSRQFAGSSRAL